MRILIGYDGSKHSDAALDDLNLAGLPRTAKSLVVSVADPLMRSRPVREVVAQAMPSRGVFSIASEPQLHGGSAIEAEDFALKAADRLLLEFPGWEVATQTRAGMAAWELIDAANDWNADLVVLGSEGIPALERILLGSVSKRVVTESRRSVRVARLVERNKPDAPPKIIVGVDGSPAAQEAVYEIGRRAWPTGTQVRLITAHDQSSVTDSNQRTVRPGESMLDWAKYHLKSRALNISMSIQSGDPKRVLLGEARKWRADCIFVGTRNFKTGFERYQLGSVSTAVVTKAPCSVEVVRPIE
jgi:nucleotide-binding universal stress UspA family protein